MNNTLGKKRFLKIGSQNIYLWLIAIALGDGYVILTISNRIASIIPFHIISGAVLMYGLFGILYLIKLPEILRNLIQKKAWDAYFVILLYVLSAIVFVLAGWNNRVLVNADSIYRLIFFSIPVYLMIRSIKDYNLICEKLWIVAFVYFFFSIIVLSSSSRVIRDMQQGYDTYMVLGYQLGLCVLIFIENYRHTKNKSFINYLNLAFGLVSFVLVLFYGSRGTLIVCAFYFLHLFIEYGRENGFSKRIIIGIVLFCAILMFSEFILKAVLSFTNQIGINSRSVAWLLKTDSNLTSSGRNIIYTNALKSITEKPWLGWGLLGDRAIFGYYVHNLFIEIILSFGVFIGGFISISIIIGFFKSLLWSSTRRINCLVVFGIVQLMLSGSYLHNGSFWIALGIICSALFFKNIKIKPKTIEE